jgi:hypothetical protein
MIIQSKLTQKDFINANLAILYSRWGVWVITVIGSFEILAGIAGMLLSPGKDLMQLLLMGCLMVGFYPVFIYVIAKRSFNSQNRLNENIEYIFGENDLSIKGESFSSQMSWNKIYKVVLKKNWLLIYTNKQVATPILRTDVWAGEVDELKKILNSHKVKNNL